MTIDWWTLGLQAINVLVLVWLLGHFFWRPVATMIEQRRITAQKALADAEAKRTEAAAALADIERTRAGFAQERDAILKAAQETAEQAHAARLQEAAKEAASIDAAARAAIARDKDAAEKAWADRASRLALDIARRLAARLDGPAVQSTFLDWLLKEIRGLPPAARQAVASPPNCRLAQLNQSPGRQALTATARKEAGSRPGGSLNDGRLCRGSLPCFATPVLPLLVWIFGASPTLRVPTYRMSLVVIVTCKEEREREQNTPRCVKCQESADLRSMRQKASFDRSSAREHSPSSSGRE